MEKEAEKQLVQNIKQNPNQFGIIFDAHYKPIFNYIFRRLGDYDAAKDVCSETFLKAFLNIHRFRWKGIPISFWLYRIANNELQQFFRKEKYRPGSLDKLIEMQGWDAVDPASTPQSKLQAEKIKQQDADFIMIRQVIQKMPLLYQEVLALRYFEQKSIKDMALILNKKEGTIKSLLSRGIEKLRSTLG